MKTTPATLAAITSLLSLAALAPSAGAAGDKADVEKCYGVSRAGHNDCAGTVHSCQGQAKTDAGGKDWINLPKGTCERLAGGSLTAK